MRQIFLTSLVQKEDYNLMKSEDENQLMQQKYPPPCSLNLIVNARRGNRLIKGSPTCHEIFVNIIDYVLGHPVVLHQSLW